MRLDCHLTRASLVMILGSVILNAEGCSLIVDKDIKGSGIGTACGTNDDCHAGVCVQSLCTAKCGTSADCPAPTTCQPDGFCAQPLNAGFLYVGVLADQGWSYMQDQGRLAAMRQLPYLTTQFATNVITDDNVAQSATDMINKGANVILQTSQGGTVPMAALAKAHPEVTFLQLYNRTVTSPNLGSYWVQLQQSWYIAGYVAAKKSQTGRISWIGGYVSPQGVVRANGFVRGAQKFNPNIKVEVRWVGFWFDPGTPVNGKYRETLLAEQAIAAGADVVIGNIDNERPYDVVEAARIAGKDVWSIETNNPASCAKYPRSCLGVAWLNWTSLDVQQLDAIHRHAYVPGYIHAGITEDQAQSPVGFSPSDVNLTQTDTRLEIDTMISALSKDPELPLRGPYETTGQRAAVADGELISEDELLQMCWFPKGMIEKTDPNDPTSADVPAKVPQGDRTFLNAENLSAENKSLALPPDCRKNQ